MTTLYTRKQQQASNTLLTNDNDILHKHKHMHIIHIMKHTQQSRQGLPRHAADVCIRMYMCVCVCIRMCVCMRMYVYVYVYVCVLCMHSIGTCMCMSQCAYIPQLIFITHIHQLIIIQYTLV